MIRLFIVKNFSLMLTIILFISGWKVDLSPKNPESTVNEKWRKYKLTDEDFERDM